VVNQTLGFKSSFAVEKGQQVTAPTQKAVIRLQKKMKVNTK